MFAQVLGNAVALVGDGDLHRAIAVVEDHADAPAGVGGVDGVLHQVAGDEAEQAAAMAVEILVEAAVDAEDDAFFLRQRRVALAGDPGQFVPREFVGGLRGVSPRRPTVSWIIACMRSV